MRPTALATESEMPAVKRDLFTPVQESGGKNCAISMADARRQSSGNG
jgi:hypothetical protein